jgi:hypothetical protein
MDQTGNEWAYWDHSDPLLNDRWMTSATTAMTSSWSTTRLQYVYCSNIQNSITFTFTFEQLILGRNAYPRGDNARNVFRHHFIAQYAFHIFHVPGAGPTLRLRNCELCIRRTSICHRTNKLSSSARLRGEQAHIKDAEQTPLMMCLSLSLLSPPPPSACPATTVGNFMHVHVHVQANNAVTLFFHGTHYCI